MNYKSTRDNSVSVSSAQAIAMGISPDGGLFVPERIPTFNEADFETLRKLDYIGRAKYVLSRYLEDFTDEELDFCVKGAYKNTFDNNEPAKLVKLDDGKYVLELWHGPTCAFKDLALQLLPFLLTKAAKKVNKGRTIILVATSGDTGKAALEGFCDVENTDIIVFYPNNGVSQMQKLQMNTQKGNNVYVCAIEGNFDDAQTGVKKIFTDKEIAKRLADNNMEFSSANSINWGRLVPQIVYYVSTYCDLLNMDADLERGFNVTVPTGNFGNILAAFYAKEMGVPISKLICASNSNNVLTDFINSGEYNKNRQFFTTISPSMDILVSSNLERMLYHLYSNNSETTKELQNSLNEKGSYEISGEYLEKLKALYFGGCCDENETRETIKKTFSEYNYLCDTHTAVAMNVCDKYAETEKDTRPNVVVSTASPYKFPAAVLSAIDESLCKDTEFEMIDALSNATNTTVPKQISDLKTAKVRFENVCEKQDMVEVVIKYLNI